ncbi:MAG TPA: NAD(P)-binding protein, partial [Solirubrobacteraceae bacterium]
MRTIDTDYLIVGAGAGGLAFADSLIAESDADVVIVDRRDRPGGHWNDAYSFVRLHQPSAYYGVNSRVLGSDSIETAGPDAGCYGRASAPEICDYFQRVLEEHLLPSGRVRFFGMCDYRGDFSAEHQLHWRLTGELSTVRVRRRIVDATYLSPSVPSRHTPSFQVGENVSLIPINDLVCLTEPGSGYTILGAGKSATDACGWLLESGVAPEAIRWIRPRDTWLIDRAVMQPLELVGSLIEGVSHQLESAAGAQDVAELFGRLEASGQLVRIDQTVEPTMYRCATISQAEIQRVRQIENVVRLGRVLSISERQIVLEEGSIATDAKQIYVDCTADGAPRIKARTIFDGNRITPQPVRTCFPGFNAALTAFVECAREEDVEKNRLCPPNPIPNTALDWIATTAISQRVQMMWTEEPDLVAWLERSRLNVARGLEAHLNEPQVQAALARYLANNEQAMDRL